MRKVYRASRDYSTFAPQFDECITGSYFELPAVELLRPRRQELLATSDLFMQHYFDVLGSGWVEVGRRFVGGGWGQLHKPEGASDNVDPSGEWLSGLINPGNLSEAQRIWRMIDPGYRPIDWQLDVKSGYRWRERTWHKGVVAARRKTGVDVKVPWEMARMQHLTSLAWAHVLATDADDSVRAGSSYTRCMRNQILDFIATNPPGYGVNWSCSMEVAIRVSNWLIAHDLARAAGAVFDRDFEREFARSVHQHGEHIIENLEWSETAAGNHYLANIVGLLFVAAYLPRTPRRDVRLAFGVQELVSEVRRQFHPEGSNFEGSTSYHRLSGEMVAYATALVLGMPDERLEALRSYDTSLHEVRPELKEAPIPFYDGVVEDRAVPFPHWYVERLRGMACFTVGVSKPSGCVVQVGDNDSGRFVRCSRVYEPIALSDARRRFAHLRGYEGPAEVSTYWLEHCLDHRHLVAAINGIVGDAELARFYGGEHLEQDLLAKVVRRRGSILAGGEVAADSCMTGGLPGSYQRRDHGTRSSGAAGVEQSGDVSAGETRRQGPVRESVSTYYESLKGSIGGACRHLSLPLPEPVLVPELRLRAFEDFGLYVYRAGDFFLSVRCGQRGQDGKGGHDHNDQLGIELAYGSQDLILDPGTYLYTADASARNRYRSAAAHFVPRWEDGEPGNLEEGLFRIGPGGNGTALFVNDTVFIGCRHDRFGTSYRWITVGSDAVDVWDWYVRQESGGEVQGSSPAGASVLFSPGYGMQENRACVVIEPIVTDDIGPHELPHVNECDRSL